MGKDQNTSLSAVFAAGDSHARTRSGRIFRPASRKMATPRENHGRITPPIGNTSHATKAFIRRIGRYGPHRRVGQAFQETGDNKRAKTLVACLMLTYVLWCRLSFKGAIWDLWRADNSVVGGTRGVVFGSKGPSAFSTVVHVFCRLIVMTAKNNQAVSNYVIFRDCFSSAIFQRSQLTSPKRLKRRAAKGGRKEAKSLQSEEQGNLDMQQHGDQMEEMAEFSGV